MATLLAEPRGSGGAPLDAPHVLLVDDDVAMASTISDILTIHGFKTHTAANGQRALTLAREMEPPPSVAVVDLRLPDMDGLDLASQLHSQSEELQIVILTGNASVETAIRALRDAHCDYLLKPVSPTVLISTLRAAEGRRQLRHTEATLRHTQELVRTVFHASPLPLVAVDTFTAVTLWNAAAERVFGWTEDEVMGRQAPMVSFDRQAEARALDRAALRGETTVGVQVQRRRRDGSALDMRVSTAPLTDGNGNVSGVLAVYEDITERRKIEEHLRDAHRLDQIGRLAGGVAHDFNNLLAVILAETDLALRDTTLSAEVRDTLESVNRAADSGAVLTRQLLALARRQAVSPVLFSLNAMVTDLERMLKSLLGERVTLELSLARDLWNVKVDRGQLEHVLTNLAVNARDAMAEGGAVTITTANVPAWRPGGPAGLEGRDWVMLSMRDTGHGIPDDVRARLFEPFFTTKERGKGTGLGLATSYGIVQRFGGKFTVESAAGQGATFWVHLPRAPDGGDVASPARQTPARLGTERVLVVDDQVELLGLARKILRNQGYAVEVASTGLQAIQVAELMLEPPDLVVLDVNLPDGDGREVMRRLRERYPRVRVLLTSGAFADSGAVGTDAPFLAKPYSFDSLARAVRSALDG